MKKWNRFLGLSIGLILLVAVCINVFLEYKKDGTRDKFYQVEINRLMNEIRQGKEGFSCEELSLENCKAVQHVERITVDADKAKMEEFLTGKEGEYQVRYEDGFLYRFDYVEDVGDSYKMVQLTLNLILLFCLLVIVGMMVYIKYKILAPFHQIQDMPYELSKGNLVCDVKEEKNKYFGKFVWGISLLRDKIEENRKRELNLQKEKKTLILSLSHDIKTPLSAIKLYAKALSQKLYDTEEAQTEIAEKIDGKVNEIEDYVNQIIRASKEDFLHLEVEPGECYVKELLESLRTYYTEKLSLTGCHFEIAPYENCLLNANRDRSIEVLQNLMENAIKYGDGERIEIRTEYEEDCLLITVMNTGCTLPSSELSHIFESFWRGSNAETKPGSGMGLYICRTIMHKMLGDIYASMQGEKIQITCVFRKV